jgi:hypothetical protein
MPANYIATRLELCALPAAADGRDHQSDRADVDSAVDGKWRNEYR